MSLNEKPIFGAHVVEADDGHRPHINLSPPKSSLDNTSSTSLTPTCEQTPTATEEYNPASSHPFSAFYLHPTTRTSFEQHKSESKVHIGVHEQDLEAASSTFRSSEVTRSTQDSEVWPCKQQTKKRYLIIKRSSGCSPLRGLTGRQRFWVKVVIAVLVVGAAVGIGIGISKAVGAGVWKNPNSQGNIGGSR